MDLFDIKSPKDWRIFGEMYKISSLTSEKIQKPLLNDFVFSSSDVPVWSKAVDFDSPVSLPSGETVKGFRFIDFKDCTNAYVLNSKNEAYSFYVLSLSDQNSLLDYMDSFAKERKRVNRISKAKSQLQKFSNRVSNKNGVDLKR